MTGSTPERKRDAIADRKRYLPIQLEATRRKLRMLENEARRYGMTELLEAGQ